LGRYSSSPRRDLCGGATRIVGQTAAVHGRVAVVRSGDTKPVLLKVPDEIYGHDVIETDSAARSKILLADDTLLTIGAGSLVEMAEHVYEPESDTRSITLKLESGKLRALVGRTFAGHGSKFVVRTPTGFAAGQGSYFVIWIDGTTTGTANIGSAGQVSFTSGGRTVILNPGQFTTTAGSAPLPGRALNSSMPGEVAGVLTATDYKEVFISESAKDVLRSLGRKTQSDFPVPSQRLAAPYTPPAVISGAAPSPNVTALPAAPAFPTGPGSSAGSSSSTPAPSASAPAPPPAPVPPPPPRPPTIR
jgi:FecR-like protein